MIINTKGIEVSENVYLNKEGKFLLQITKFEMDGTTSAGDPRFKFTFKGVEVGTKEPVYLHSEQFSAGANALWRVKQLEVAIKAPEVYDLNDFVGRYVISNVKQDTFTKKDGTVGTSYKVKSWEYSSFNDKLPPIPEAKEDKNDSVSVDVDDSAEIPF